ncbi:MAG: hypothetical protein IID43_04910 [Planctomycetes bacterium]|nr:hypothetical protein [Planctomycetota bacterium]
MGVIDRTDPVDRKAQAVWRHIDNIGGASDGLGGINALTVAVAAAAGDACWGRR